MRTYLATAVALLFVALPARAENKPPSWLPRYDMAINLEHD